MLLYSTINIFNLEKGKGAYSKGKKKEAEISPKEGRRIYDSLSEQKLKHFCDKFVGAVLKFVVTEEKKIEAEQIDKMITPSDEVI